MSGGVSPKAFALAAEIRKYQRSADLLIRKLPFARIVREISQIISPEVTRWTAEALTALQEAAEAWIVGLLVRPKLRVQG